MTTFAPPTDEMKVQFFGYLIGAPEGPWTGEPDKAHWVDPVSNLDCLIVRNSGHGALCGYAGIPFEHQLHGADFRDVAGIEVHDGLSYSSLCDEGFPDGICHTPLPGRPANVWWFGFAGRGTWDYAPLFEHRMAMLAISEPIFADIAPNFLDQSPVDHYRDFGFMYLQATSLARQLMALA